MDHRLLSFGLVIWRCSGHVWLQESCDIKAKTVCDVIPSK